MPGLLVDSSVILDVLEDHPEWAERSARKLDSYARSHDLFINAIIYAEVSIGFARIEELDAALAQAGFISLTIPREALFLAGKAFIEYKRRKGDPAPAGPAPSAKHRLADSGRGALGHPGA